MEVEIEQYLRDHLAYGCLDHVLRAQVAADGRLTFYIHPQGRDGDTQDYEVNGNVLAHNRDVWYAVQGG